MCRNVRQVRNPPEARITRYDKVFYEIHSPIYILTASIDISLKPYLSQPNNRLFVGSIPKTKTKEEIFDEFSKHTTGLTDVILYYQVEERNKGQGMQKNRGFCFLEYETHQAASQARRRLLSGNILRKLSFGSLVLFYASTL